MRSCNRLENNSFRHILKSSASMYEHSGSQFFRTTTRILSEPDAFDESRFSMTVLTFLEAMKTLCCFRLVLEGKTGTRGKRDTRVAKIRVLGKVFSILFCFTRCRSQYLCLLNRGGIADLLRNLLAIRQNSRGQVMESFVLVPYASLAASSTLLHRLLACLNFTFESEDLFWNISQMITKTIPISTRIVLSYAMKRSILLWVY